VSKVRLKEIVNKDSLEIHATLISLLLLIVTYTKL